MAKVEWHPGELFPRVGFVVTNLIEADAIFFGGLSMFLRRPVISDSSHQSMPKCRMWLQCPWDDRRFVRHLGNVSLKPPC